MVEAQTEVQWLGLETLNWGAGTGSGTGGGDGCWKAQGTAAVVTVGGDRDAGRRRASLGGRM